MPYDLPGILEDVPAGPASAALDRLGSYWHRSRLCGTGSRIMLSERDPKQPLLVGANTGTTAKLSVVLQKIRLARYWSLTTRQPAVFLVGRCKKCGRYCWSAGMSGAGLDTGRAGVVLKVARSLMKPAMPVRRRP